MDALYREGPLNGPLVFVGEAPGAEEERQGGAFVGPAGDLLTTLMNTAGIPRPSCYLDNVFQFRPRENNLEPFIRFAPGRVHETEIYRTQRAALIERLLQTSASTIVTLGNVPTYALTGRTKITKQRGSVLSCPELPGRKIIPTIHPSAALRGIGSRKSFSSDAVEKDGYYYRYWIAYDLRRAWSNAQTWESPLLQRRINLRPSFEEAIDFIGRARVNGEAAYDIETRGLELSHISIALSPTEGICIPFVDGQQDYWGPEDEVEVMRALKAFLQDPSVSKVGQNLTFDATFLYSKYGIITSPLNDTMVAQGILFPDYPKGLDFLTSIYCEGEPYYKDDGKEWFKNPFASEELFRRYNAMDSLVLMQIWPQQREELVRTGNTETYRNQVALIHPLVYAGNLGIQMDLPGIAEARASCVLRIETLQAELNELCGRELNINSPKQLQQYFYIDKHLKAHTKDGRVTVDDKALKLIAAKGHKEAELILKLRHESKMLGTYYDMKLDPDGRMRCSFNPVGTAQGRISSSKTIRGTGGNFQNIPPDLQKYMVSDPGFLVVNQDLGQAENRVVAYVAGEERMITAFERGTDIHSQTASLIYGVPMDQVTEELRAGGKRANHGLNYDLGASQFSRYYQVSLDEATFVVEAYHRAYPGIREWHAAVRYELSQNNRTLVNLYGRRRTFLARWGDDLFKVGYSYVPQSTVADHMNRFGVLFLYYEQGLFPEVQFLNTIHDSIRYQIPLSLGFPRIIEIILSIKESLETPLSARGRFFKIPADTEIGFSFDKKTMLSWKAKKVSALGVEGLTEELAGYVQKTSKLD